MPIQTPPAQPTEVARFVPTVSVVCPTYNAPALLQETLESVFAQTFHDYELIIVDDGSTDHTPDVLAELQKRHPERLRVVRQENQGIGAARNRGIDEARGHYVALLDHDDLWHPKKLDMQVQFHQAHPDCVATVVPFAISDAPTVAAFNVDAVAGPDGIVAAPLRKLAENHGFMTTSSVLMFNRTRAAGLRYATTRGAIEDAPFYIKLFARGLFGIAGRDVLALYRVHAGGSSRRPAYFYHGLRNLRRFNRTGGFDEFQGPSRRDLDAYLAYLGRVAAMNQILGGARLSAAKVYLSELPHQLRHWRWKFLIGFVPLLLAPWNPLSRRSRQPKGHTSSDATTS